MPIFIFEEDAFEKMVAVEGEEYRECRNGYGANSFDVFLKYWEEHIKPYPEALNDLSLRFSVSPDCGAIYGFHGYNRYIVYNSGEIVFLRQSDSSNDKRFIKKAEEVGFRLSSKQPKEP